MLAICFLVACDFQDDSNNGDTQIETFTVSISVSCQNVLDNTDKLDSDKSYLLDSLPTDGYIINDDVTAEDGDSVLAVLIAVLKSHNQQYSISFGYVSGIANLYEFDCGGGSGWVVLVNSEFISVGASSCYVTSGDKIEWIYTVSQGDT